MFHGPHFVRLGVPGGAHIISHAIGKWKFQGAALTAIQKCNKRCPSLFNGEDSQLNIRVAGSCTCGDNDIAHGAVGLLDIT